MADNKNTSYEAGIGWAIMGIILFVLLLLFWHFFQYEIKSAFRWWRWFEMWLTSFFIDEQGYTLRWRGMTLNFKQWLDGAATVHPTKLDKNTLSAMSIVAMSPLKYVFTVGIAIMGMWAIMYGPGTQYRRKMNLDGLIFAQSKIFPVIAPFVKFNPGNQPPRPPGAPVPSKLPSFAEALSPEEWIAYNQIPLPDGNVDEQAAYEAFAKQLGPRWQGAHKLPPYKQVLLACFCLKASRKRKESDTMLGRLAMCWSHEKGLELHRDKKLLADARKVLNDKKLAGSTLAKCNMHAFQTTALLRGLLTAREEGGVLAPAQFVWLRGFDRSLWYPLNNLGRHAFHMEALAAMAHFKSERLTRRPIPRPKVDDAVKALVTHMKSPAVKPIPQLDYQAGKESGIKKPKKK